MTSRPELGRFLRTRRAQLQPVDVGLPMFDEERRVPGLRRDVEITHQVCPYSNSTRGNIDVVLDTTV